MLKKIVDKTRAKFNVSMIEIADSNLWQKGRIGFSVIGIHKDHVHSAIDKVQEYVESLYMGEVVSCWAEIIVMGNEV